MNTETRQWFKQSERPVTEADCPVWVESCRIHPVLCLTPPSYIGFRWTHAAADIPAPPKEEEESQEDRDWAKWRKLNGRASTFQFTDIADFAAYARADERARLGKEVEKWIANPHPNGDYDYIFNDLRALFTESTNNRETK